MTSFLFYGASSMDSPLTRIILFVIGGYFIVLLFLGAYEWIRKEYPRPPSSHPSTERIQHPFYYKQAKEALKRFAGLTKTERVAIKESLKSGLISMEQWMIHLDQSDYQIMCIGELHKDSTRNFLAEEFFKKFSVDVLLLEATPKELKRLIKRMNAGRTYYPLLDADIMRILRAVEVRNPDIKIYGIEETDKQKKTHHGFAGSRDKAIARNFWYRFQPGIRHVILLGALHCTNEPNWLFENLRSQAPFPLKKRLLNVYVLGEHQNGPLGTFLYFLDEIGIDKKDFVIPDTSALHPHIYEWFQLLNHQILKKFSTLIVFRIPAKEIAEIEANFKIE